MQKICIPFKSSSIIFFTLSLLEPLISDLNVINIFVGGSLKKIDASSWDLNLDLALLRESLVWAHFNIDWFSFFNCEKYWLDYSFKGFFYFRCYFDGMSNTSIIFNQIHSLFLNQPNNHSLTLSTSIISKWTPQKELYFSKNLPIP